jgi:hypothetical protein
MFLIFINDLDDDVKEIEILRKFSGDTKMGQTVAIEKQIEKI